MMFLFVQEIQYDAEIDHKTCFMLLSCLYRRLQTSFTLLAQILVRDIQATELAQWLQYIRLSQQD